MRVFVSHGSADTWVARQMARCISDCGATTFIDSYDLKSGDDFEQRIFRQIDQSQHMVVLITPFSRRRAWLWMEVGVARSRGLRIAPILYGVTRKDLARDGGYPLGHLVERELNHFGHYLDELRGGIANG